MIDDSKTGKPTAIYKDNAGKNHKFSDLCPHMKGVVCWHRTKKSRDCPVHESMFSKDGVCVIGLAKVNLQPADDSGKDLQGVSGIFCGHRIVPMYSADCFEPQFSLLADLDRTFTDQ